VKDHHNSLCVVCPLGIFKSGQLVFPELKLVVHVKVGQAVAFRSKILVHRNLPVLTGVHHSVVFFIHGTMIKQPENLDLCLAIQIQVMIQKYKQILKKEKSNP
ncbi:1389_t:CDS:1, partial [Gigaspora margarita]